MRRKWGEKGSQRKRNVFKDTGWQTDRRQTAKGKVLLPGALQALQVLWSVKMRVQERRERKREGWEWKRLVLSPKLGIMAHGTSPLGLKQGQRCSASLQALPHKCAWQWLQWDSYKAAHREINTLGLIIKIRTEAQSTLGTISHLSLVWVEDKSTLIEKPKWHWRKTNPITPQLSKVETPFKIH